MNFLQIGITARQEEYYHVIDDVVVEGAFGKPACMVAE